MASPCDFDGKKVGATSGIERPRGLPVQSAHWKHLSAQAKAGSHYAQDQVVARARRWRVKQKWTWPVIARSLSCDLVDLFGWIAVRYGKTSQLWWRR